MVSTTGSPFVIGCPSMATMASPGCSPACAAGQGPSGEAPLGWPHMGTSMPTRLVIPIGTPNPAAIIARITPASSRFISGPAATMAMRTPTGLPRKEPASSSCSSKSSPAMRTYPPKGIRLIV